MAVSGERAAVGGEQACVRALLPAPCSLPDPTAPAVRHCPSHPYPALLCLSSQTPPRRQSTEEGMGPRGLAAHATFHVPVLLCPPPPPPPPPRHRRSTEEGVGPRGGDAPYVSPEGHALIDIRFCEWAPPAHCAAAWLGLAGSWLPWLRVRSALRSARTTALYGSPSRPQNRRPLPWRLADEGLKLLGEDADYGSIAREIESVEGVVAHGLMANVAAAAVVATAAGPRLVWRGEQLAAGAGRGGSLGEA